MAIKSIKLAEVQRVAYYLTKKYADFSEPIPEFVSRYPNVLESCLLVPFQKYDKKPLYKGLSGKSAILFYLMIKNHPFQNGNKRIAISTLLLFLFKNNKWLQVDNVVFYNFAVWIASSPPDMKEETVMAIEKFVKKNLVKK